jgi:hypothetical protein
MVALELLEKARFLSLGIMISPLVGVNGVDVRVFNPAALDQLLGQDFWAGWV